MRGERARAQPALLTAAVDQRPQPERRLAPHVQRTDAFRAVDLVRRERQQVDVHRFDVERQLAGALRCIDVKQRRRARDRSRRSAAMSCMTPISLFTCMSETSCVSARSAARTCSGCTMPSRVRLQLGDLEAFALELLQRIEHGLVLGAWPRRGVGRDPRGSARRRRSRGCPIRWRRTSRRCIPGARRSRAATCARAFSTSARARRPNSWPAEEGLPCAPLGRRHSIIASATRGSTGVVAA